MMVCRVARGVAVVVVVAVAVEVVVDVVVVVAVGEPVGVCASAVHPVRPITKKAPAYATRLTLSTAAPHSRRRAPSIHPSVDAAHS